MRAGRLDSRRRGMARMKPAARGLLRRFGATDLYLRGVVSLDDVRRGARRRARILSAKK
jgi:hypothetical protein